MNRRNFLLGAAVTLVAAPAIVRVASIMPVKALPLAEVPINVWWRCEGGSLVGHIGREDPRGEGWEKQTIYEVGNQYVARAC